MVDWMDVTELPFHALLLLERIQMSWLPDWVSETELALALRAHPMIAWTMRRKCPEIAGWLDEVVGAAPGAAPSAMEVRAAEEHVMRQINDLLVYVMDPAIYDAQPFLAWDSRVLTERVRFAGKTVIDVGAGTGRLTFVAAPAAATVFAVEPVENLRHYLRQAAAERGYDNVFAMDGLITRIPFPDAFADVTMGGHVFGDEPEAECRELLRVTRPGGAVVLCPGNVDKDNEAHRVLLRAGFEWSCFEEPGDGMKRIYWCQP